MVSTITSMVFGQVKPSKFFSMLVFNRTRAHRVRERSCRRRICYSVPRRRVRAPSSRGEELRAHCRSEFGGARPTSCSVSPVPEVHVSQLNTFFTLGYRHVEMIGIACPSCGYTGRGDAKNTSQPAGRGHQRSEAAPAPSSRLAALVSPLKITVP